MINSSAILGFQVFKSRAANVVRWRPPWPGFFPQATIIAILFLVDGWPILGRDCKAAERVYNLCFGSDEISDLGKKGKDQMGLRKINKQHNPLLGCTVEDQTKRMMINWSKFRELCPIARVVFLNRDFLGRCNVNDGSFLIHLGGIIFHAPGLMIVLFVLGGSRLRLSQSWPLMIDYNCRKSNRTTKFILPCSGCLYETGRVFISFSLANYETITERNLDFLLSVMHWFTKNLACAWSFSRLGISSWTWRGCFPLCPSEFAAIYSPQPFSANHNYQISSVKFNPNTMAFSPNARFHANNARMQSPPVFNPYPRPAPNEPAFLANVGNARVAVQHGETHVFLHRSIPSHKEHLAKFCLVAKVFGKKFQFVRSLGNVAFSGRILLALIFHIRRWSPSFHSATAVIETLILWIRLPNFPLHHWSSEGIEAAVGVLGRFIKVDDRTLNGDNYIFARVKMEIDLRTPLKRTLVIRDEEEEDMSIPWNLRIDPARVLVSYEAIFEVCFECGSHRHKIRNCPFRLVENHFVLVDREESDADVEHAGVEADPLIRDFVSERVMAYFPQPADENQDLDGPEVPPGDLNPPSPGWTTVQKAAKGKEKVVLGNPKKGDMRFNKGGAGSSRMVSRGKSYSDAAKGTGAVIIGGTSENTDAEDYLSGDEGVSSTTNSSSNSTLVKFSFEDVKNIAKLFGVYNSPYPTTALEEIYSPTYPLDLNDIFPDIDMQFENYPDLGTMMAMGTLPKQHDEVMYHESVAPLVASSPGANSVVARKLSGDDKGFKSPRKRTRDMMVEAEVDEMGGSSPNSIKNKE
ncbi:hypothetical protein ACLB2K_002783 [Fragaria x ananassa]